MSVNCAHDSLFKRQLKLPETIVEIRATFPKDPVQKALPQLAAIPEALLQGSLSIFLDKKWQVLHAKTEAANLPVSLAIWISGVSLAVGIATELVSIRAKRLVIPLTAKVLNIGFSFF